MLQLKRKIKRQETILSSLADLTYATREQLQIVNDLAGDRNARRVLLDMERDGLIKSLRHEKKIYYLSNRGNEKIGRSQSRLKKSWITHTLMRNDLYIKLGVPRDWEKEVPVKQNEEVVLIPDAMFTDNGHFCFVEIDNRQSMRTNYDKISKYKILFKSIYREYKHHPTLIWYSLSTIRKGKLESSCSKAGIKYHIY